METSVMHNQDANKSFSFNSNYKYSSSSLELFTDEDEKDDLNHNTDSDTEENSFIEITFDNPKIKQTDNDEDKSSGGRGFQDNFDHLRISFSSSFPSSIHDQVRNINYVSLDSTHRETAASIKALSAFSSSSSSLSSLSSVRLSASTMRSSSTGTSLGPAVVGSESFNVYESSRRRDQLTAFNPLVHTLLFSLDAPPHMADQINGLHYDRKDNHRQLGMINANNRKSSITQVKNSTKGSSTTSGIMKFLMIKFRATKVRKLLASLFAKSHGHDHLHFYPNKANAIDRSYKPKRLLRSSKETRALDCYHHDHHQGMYVSSSYSYNNDNNANLVNDIKYSSHNQHRCSRALDVNMGAVKGVLGGVNMTRSGHNNSSRSSNRKTSSCPSSVKSSPIHQGFANNDANKFFAAENSVQAAIAHCKSSLGQASDFRF
ncbi:uncharacterized protein LOC133777464 isoform X2 [Humulus lupulus]|uniref:uncharacterized protein LOC133777464 isoform X2 n=1 Tax=Humulus lupulus TaxID=3486 RepID=UPI002B40B7FA|nr:uncharacterized protein LOC133777464 isoform X2 [Humulus lupulus]